MTRNDMQKLLNSPELAEKAPELNALKGIPQPPEYHAEGDVFTHTRLAVSALPEDAEERLVWAVALHDIGKAETTRFKDGRWRAHGHDTRSAELVPQVLERFGATTLIHDVVWLVRNHQFAGSWQPQTRQRLTKGQLKFCRHPLFPLLILVCRADSAASYGRSDKVEQLQRILQQLALEEG